MCRYSTARRLAPAPPHAAAARHPMRANGTSHLSGGATSYDVTIPLATRQADRREPDSEAFIRPQRRYADMLMSYLPRDGDRSEGQTHLDAELTLCDGLPHPDLVPGFVNGEPEACNSWRTSPSGFCGYRAALIRVRPRRSRRRSGSAWISPPTCASGGSGGVHGRNRALPIRVPRARPAVDSPSPGDREGEGGAGNDGTRTPVVVAP